MGEAMRAVAVLEPVSTTAVPATIGKFVAKEKFLIDSGRDALIKIGYLNHNFRLWFLSGDGKIEDSKDAQVLRYHRLRQSSMDSVIIAELGGEARAEISLSSMFSLLGQVPWKDGVLLSNGWENVFYIKDSTEVLRAVYVYYSRGGWLVGAEGIDCPDGRSQGRQIFSRS